MRVRHMYHVYILRSAVSGRRYIGVTIDLERRLKDHNRGKDRSVRGRGPFELVWSEAYASRIEAYRRERQIKRFKGGEALQRLLGSTQDASALLSPSSNG